jgi:hypothetical protein
MDKLLISQRYVPAKRSTTSDCKIDYGSSTAEPDNLAAVLKNNTLLFECFMMLSDINVVNLVEKAHEHLKD